MIMGISVVPSHYKTQSSHIKIKVKHLGMALLPACYTYIG